MMDSLLPSSAQSSTPNRRRAISSPRALISPPIGRIPTKRSTRSDLTHTASPIPNRTRGVSSPLLDRIPSPQRLYGSSAQSCHSSSSVSEPNGEAKFTPGDPANPRNWPVWRKWSIVAAITLIDLSVSWAASGYSPAQKKMQELWGVGETIGTLGLSLYVLGLAVGPMFTAPLSEHFGRSPVYIISYGTFLLFLMGTALARHLPVFLTLRFFSGVFSSVPVASFGGTIADLWDSHDTGPAMSVFLWAATCGSPSGFFLFSFIPSSHSLQDVFWALLGVCGALWLIMCVTIRETRHSIILARSNGRAMRATQQSHRHSSIQIIKDAAANLVQKALKRPFMFLGTEAIVQFCALYNGYLYGISFMFNGAFVVVFGGGGFGFDTVGVGLCFLGIILGISLGPITNALVQEPYFQKKLKENNYKNIPEARVLMGKVAAVLFPLSLFVFALTCGGTSWWGWSVLASAVWGWAFYTILLMTYTYVEDSYRTYSASALAGMGLVKNLAGGLFPLFGKRMFSDGQGGLGKRGAMGLLAGLALWMVGIPFVLGGYGRGLRESSPWARVHLEGGGDAPGECGCGPGEVGRDRNSVEGGEDGEGERLLVQGVLGA